MKGLISQGFFVLAAALVLGLSACQSKKATEDSMAPDATGTDAAPIKDEAMDFNASGSDSGQIKGLGTIHFEYDRSTLSPEAKKTLAGNVAWMKARPKTKMAIEGHCDTRGSNEYNLALGERRAKAVKAYMISMGVPGSRLSTVSYGKEKPLAMGDSESDHYKNRRANFVPAE